MHFSNESLLVIILVGIVAGWLAGQIVRGGGFGLIGDLVVGVIGAFIGDWLLPRLNIHLGVGTVALIVNATIGAIVLLILLRVFAGNLLRPVPFLAIYPRPHFVKLKALRFQIAKGKTCVPGVCRRPGDRYSPERYVPSA